MKITNGGANRRAERSFVDLTSPLHETSVSGRRCAIACVNDYTWFKIIPLLKSKSDPAGALSDIPKMHVVPCGFEVVAIRTDGGSELAGQIQSLLDKFGLLHEHTPPQHAPI